MHRKGGGGGGGLGKNQFYEVSGSLTRGTSFHPFGIPSHLHIAINRYSKERQEMKFLIE